MTDQSHTPGSRPRDRLRRGAAPWLARAVFGLVLLLPACALRLGDGGSASGPSEAPEAPPAPSEPDGSPTPPESSAPDGRAVAPACPPTSAATVGTVATPGLTETSGLAASQERPGRLWAHNDSGSAAAVHAIGSGGEDQGRVAVPAIDGIDIEDMALADGMLYLADIGDNNAQRDGVTVYRFPEPDPAATGEITAVERVELRYPDGAIDAEAMFVDPATGRLVIVAKALTLRLGGDSPVGPGPAPIFVVDPVWGGPPMTMTQVGTVALDELDDQAEGPIPEGLIADFGLAGLATGADIRADGSMIAIRTYRTVWLFPRAPGQSVADALAGVPCPARTVPEAQGEAVAFLNGGDGSFATVSEGTNPALNVTTVG
ncbi:MAG: hypothetical protein AAFN30_02980 [Actinomycetota bacterium]